MHVNNRMHGIVSQQFQDCFGEIRKLPVVHHITIDPTVPPVAHPPRKLPIPLKEMLHTELHRLVKMGIIKPVHHSNSLVAVEKSNGKIRILLDPNDLNKAIKRLHLPATEEILASTCKPNVSQNGLLQCLLKNCSRRREFQTPYIQYPDSAAFHFKATIRHSFGK